jgi:FMN phosphatase YigB (HAD superfamily)
MANVKMVCFDMDGTIADLYGVNGWLEGLRAYDPTPYIKAEPMWDMTELAEVLMKLQIVGIEIRIITWLSVGSTTEYDNEVRKAKREWLENMGFPYDHFHGVKYGTTKASCVSRYLEENETAILIDDNAKVRNGWSLGDTIDPTNENVIETLKALFDSL